MLGSTLNNRYRINVRLGAGAMGEVYRATDTNTNQEVAIKILARHLTFDPDMLERFRREGEALRQLRHSNIVGFVDTFQHEGQQVIVLEYVPGGSLHQLIKQGPLPIDQACRIALELCDALTRAHHLKIIHRDIKPENVLLAEDGTPKLSDFGVARLVSEGTRLTGTGTQVGTPFYMSPEAWQGQRLDGQADIWSLGVLLYEMLAGQVPFGGDTLVAVMNKVLTAPLPDLKPLRPEVPPELVKIVRKMLTRDKTKRYQTIREVGLDLERVAEAIAQRPEPDQTRLQQEGQRLGPDRAKTQVEEQKTKPTGGLPKRGLVIGIVVAGLLVLCGLVVAGGLGWWAVTNLNSAGRATQTALISEFRATETALAVALAPSATMAANGLPARTPTAPSATPQPAAKLTAVVPSAPKVVTIALLQEPDLVQSLFSSSLYSAWVAQFTVTGLAVWDNKGNLVPELAADIPSADNGGISKDGLTITWKLRAGLQWSDGQPLTSADVKFTWQAITDKGNAVYTRSGYDQISSIDTPDETTAVLHFSSLYAGWQTLFTSGAYGAGPLLPEHLLNGKTALEKDPYIHWPKVASGQWVITEWVAGDHLTLKPNPNYWRGAPKLTQINIKVVTDTTAELVALKAGDVDLAPEFAETDIGTISALEPQVHLRVDVGPDVEHYLFNLGTTAGFNGQGKSDVDGPCPFQDVHVRKAIVLGIDRQALIDKMLYSKVTVPASLWPNSFWTDTNLEPYPYDPEQAKALLDQAGYRPGPDGIRAGTCGGRTVRLSFNFETTARQSRKDMAAAIAEMLSKIGVELKPIYTPAGTFFGTYSTGANMMTGKFDMAGYTNGWYPDPYTDSFLCSTVPSHSNQGGDNNYHLCDPKLDALFIQANTTADRAVRKAAFDAIQQYQYDNVLFIPLYTRANVYGFADRFIFPPSGVVSGFGWNSYDWDVK
jgi:peptide/nickel transport system substrate-binding protein